MHLPTVKLNTKREKCQTTPSVPHRRRAWFLFCLACVVGMWHLFLVTSRQSSLESFVSTIEDDRSDGEEVDQELSVVADKMAERKRRIQMACQNPGNRRMLLEEYAKYLNVEKNWTVIDSKLPYRQEFLVYRQKKIGWCKVPKASSASMVRVLLRKLANLQFREGGIWGHSILASVMPPLKEGEEYENLKTFIIVRHPFSRILSAFRDKFHTRTRKLQFKIFRTKFARQIIQKYRQTPILTTTYADMPTFREFCQYLIDTPPKDYNEHWIPYFLSCAPCHIHYKSILQVETLQDDLFHLRNMTGINLQLEHQHATPIQSEDFKALRILNPEKWSLWNDSVKEAIEHDIKLPEEQTSWPDLIQRSFYGTLTKDILTKLYEIYRLDFQMFGYSVHPYDQYVQ